MGLKSFVYSPGSEPPPTRFKKAFSRWPIFIAMWIAAFIFLPTLWVVAVIGLALWIGRDIRTTLDAMMDVQEEIKTTASLGTDRNFYAVSHEFSYDEQTLNIRSNVNDFDVVAQPIDDLAQQQWHWCWLSARTAAILLTRRAGSLRAHSGQWALPGGRIDAGETAEEGRFGSCKKR